jgi:hypothetical protein
MSSSQTDVTALLGQVTRGNQEAAEKLIPLVYIVIRWNISLGTCLYRLLFRHRQFWQSLCWRSGELDVRRRNVPVSPDHGGYSIHGQ